MSVVRMSDPAKLQLEFQRDWIWIIRRNLRRVEADFFFLFEKKVWDVGPACLLLKFTMPKIWQAKLEKKNIIDLVSQHESLTSFGNKLNAS